ncbi:MAG: hypothetical protein AB2421_10735, partial [Thermotaleaceae bacterium]
MIQFLDIRKQSVTTIEDITIFINAHFLTDSSQAWIFSNRREEEGICEVYIHYITPENNKKMLMEQPLWKKYIDLELPDKAAKQQLLDHIDQPLIHVILNVHQKYKHMTKDLVPFIFGILKKNHNNIEEIQIDTFVYKEIVEFEG